VTADILGALPARQGHFLLESGYHTDLWLTLDALFVDPLSVLPLVAALGDRLRPHGVSAVCGPLLGGAFLAHALAMRLGVGFFYTESRPVSARAGLFTAEYRLPSEQELRVQGQRVAVVDDVISAGSSVRATVLALTAAGASVVVVAAFLALGDAAIVHFTERGVPVETLQRREFAVWEPGDCPLCLEGRPLEDPRVPESPTDRKGEG
jgi:orotate phosphoribosyltransferase